MVELKIDGEIVRVAPGTTVLEAARGLGIEIPALCYLPDNPPITSCMLCVVKEAASGKLFPSCSAVVADGMHIETSTDEVHASRRAALELLLSDHVGDCEGPCQRACPLHPDIPSLIRLVAAGRVDEAAAALRAEMALAGVLGRLCSAPCEKVCRRSQVDEAVSIRLLHRFVTDTAGVTRDGAGHRDQRIAVVGAGPAGLAAAYYLALAGYACTLFERENEAGGTLRQAVRAGHLPRELLDAEIGMILDLGVTLRTGVCGVDAAAREQHAAVLDAAGAEDGAPPDGALTLRKRERPLVRVIADAKQAAAEVVASLQEAPRVEMPYFNSIIGRIKDEEKAPLMAGVAALPRALPAGGAGRGFSGQEAAGEAERCVHCDCRKPAACKLRRYAAEYGARQQRYKPRERRVFEQVREHPDVLFEQGKCISCGICVTVAREGGEAFGLTLAGRGMATRLSVPFGTSWAQALAKTAQACAAACPTGALVLKEL